MIRTDRGAEDSRVGRVLCHGQENLEKRVKKKTLPQAPMPRLRMEGSLSNNDVFHTAVPWVALAPATALEDETNVPPADEPPIFASQHSHARDDRGLAGYGRSTVLHITSQYHHQRMLGPLVRARGRAEVSCAL